MAAVFPPPLFSLNACLSFFLFSSQAWGLFPTVGILNTAGPFSFDFSLLSFPSFHSLVDAGVSKGHSLFLFFFFGRRLTVEDMRWQGGSIFFGLLYPLFPSLSIVFGLMAVAPGFSPPRTVIRYCRVAVVLFSRSFFFLSPSPCFSDYAEDRFFFFPSPRRSYRRDAFSHSLFGFLSPFPPLLFFPKWDLSLREEMKIRAVLEPPLFSPSLPFPFPLRKGGSWLLKGAEITSFFFPRFFDAPFPPLFPVPPTPASVLDSFFGDVGQVAIEKPSP